MSRLLALLLLLAVKDIRPTVETEPAGSDVDDPSIWVNPGDPAKSLIVGTIKRPKPLGGLAVYTLDGKIVERSEEIDRPNNVDILGDICVTTERLANQLRVYRVFTQKPHMRLLGVVPVFPAPMGIGLYKRASDGALFAIVSRKSGPSGEYLWQYRLTISDRDVKGEKVRAFGTFSGTAEIEAVAVDQESQRIYYADEDCCIRVYGADPDQPKANEEITRFGTTGFRGNREGIAVAGGFVIATDQLTPVSEYHIYRKTDYRELGIVRGTARSTDGIDAIARPMGPRFPQGFLITMNEAQNNFQLYDWQSILLAVR